MLDNFTIDYLNEVKIEVCQNCKTKKVTLRRVIINSIRSGKEISIERNLCRECINNLLNSMDIMCP